MARGVLGERLRRDRFFQLGLAIVGLVVAAALLAPWIAPFDPLTGDLRNAYLLAPGGRYVLGTDTQGRDVLSRVLYGARLSLSVGLISQSVSVSLGVLLGLVAGYYGRWVDAIVMRLADVTLAFPTLLLLIAEPIRNTGKYTMADVLAYRMSKVPVRSAAAISTVAVSASYMMAQMIGAGSDLLGPAVTIAHRLLKNTIRSRIGARPYLFLTDAAATELGLPDVGLAHSEAYADAGDISGRIIELGDQIGESLR